MISRFMQIFSLKTSLNTLCKNTVFHLPAHPRIMIESAIMSLYGRIRVSEKPYYRVFYAVHIANNNNDPYLPHFLQ